MMQFILKDPGLNNSVQGDVILNKAVQKDSVQKDSTIYGDKHWKW